MMKLHGEHILGYQTSRAGTVTFRAVNPATGESLEPAFWKATEDEVDQSLEKAQSAFETYRTRSGEDRAAFLEKIADGLIQLGDQLLERGTIETALPEARLAGERARTVNQLRLFATVLREGSWVDARIDTAIRDRKPLPKPDVRRMLIPIGPVVVFSASNFPLAFSVIGGDTVSALAAGCPVVVKAHWAHPGVSELVAQTVQKAASETGLPDGVFSMLQGRGHEIGTALVRHPITQAVGFTGSKSGGRALFDVAAARPCPIPVYAEMGSVNPVFVLPSALEQRGDQLAQGLVQSVTLGSGQFCTNPGLVVGIAGEHLENLIAKTSRLIEESVPSAMLYDDLSQAYARGVEKLQKTDGVCMAAKASQSANSIASPATPFVYRTDATCFLSNSDLGEEIFGPATLFVVANDSRQMEQVARHIEGQLTASIHGTEEEFKRFAPLFSILENKAGRLICNEFPTGVEVCPSMNHGGPYPASSDVRSTSVGTAAILRFARPICFQNFPLHALPHELRDHNENCIWRLVNNVVTNERIRRS